MWAAVDGVSAALGRGSPLLALDQVTIATASLQERYRFRAEGKGHRAQGNGTSVPHPLPYALCSLPEKGAAKVTLRCPSAAFITSAHQSIYGQKSKLFASLYSFTTKVLSANENAFVIPKYRFALRTIQTWPPGAIFGVRTVTWD